MRKPELTYGWPEIAAALMWKLAPQGFVMPREVMFSLPTDRVLLEDRKPTKIVLSFISVQSAQRRSLPQMGENRATVSELQGNWQKVAVCTLWHFARQKQLGKADSVTLTVADFDAVPATKALMAGGDGQSVEWRFVDYREATRMRKWDEENEHKLLVERMHT